MEYILVANFIAKGELKSVYLTSEDVKKYDLKTQFSLLIAKIEDVLGYELDVEYNDDFSEYVGDGTHYIGTKIGSNLKHFISISTLQQ